ncbi:isrso1-transposase domain protein [Paraburkholderia xenovorans LB400]|nr:isrso1-transposase domain protein [Paraburkholderia xenovorans LB400]
MRDVKKHQDRLVTLERKTKRYPTDMIDIEWTASSRLLPRAASCGGPGQ